MRVTYRPVERWKTGRVSDTTVVRSFAGPVRTDTVPFLRRCRRFLAGGSSSVSLPPGEILREHTRRFTLAQALIHAFYAFLLYRGHRADDRDSRLRRTSAFHPLWPVAWLSYGDPTSPIRALFFFFLVTTVLAAALPGWRTVRALAFAGLLEYVALKNSYGKIGHSLHLLLLVALGLVFLPRGWERPAPAHRPRACARARCSSSGCAGPPCC